MGCDLHKPFVLLQAMRPTILERSVAADPYNGNQSKFAAAIGTSQQNISNWIKKRSMLPAEYVLKAEEVTGISRHVWRPDIYPKMEAA